MQKDKGYNPQVVHEECGIVTEYSLFGGKIDFVQTVRDLTEAKNLTSAIFRECVILLWLREDVSSPVPIL